ncbi:hypothetical protein GCM10027160_41640 [Streptomyces calidiresistens]|uniref:Uncharacterized protein n=1 Tax=Streptomyces calidiresistens TaxID=1485586 RepID=A0A7W3T3R3_9ACTN|nr:hypothetical protein [Streptomyces calidiresistens]MBB0230395.1 hypothetical protein [Streptomyces calidiresistens]
MSYGEEYRDAAARGLPTQTRTRLHEDDRDAASGRPPRSARRSLVPVVGVIVLLIAALAFANRDGGGGGGTSPTDDAPGGTQAQPTAPSGESPVDVTVNNIPVGHPQTEQGAQSAAANYAVALGGEGMFDAEARRVIVDTIYEPSVAEERLPAIEEAYSNPDFLQRIGLSADGTPPEGTTFVARVIPVGTRLTDFDETTATVEVWYTSLFGLAGEGSTRPVTEGWYTNSYELVWSNDDWRVVDFDQRDGPVPVARDQRASSAEEMAEASGEFGGFTYAR